LLVLPSQSSSAAPDQVYGLLPLSEQALERHVLPSAAMMEDEAAGVVVDFFARCTKGNAKGDKE
jgi:hypothetical protein